MFKKRIQLNGSGNLMIGSEKYVELHSLEFDIENSECSKCHREHLECNYYYGECRYEVCDEVE